MRISFSILSLLCLIFIGEADIERDRSVSLQIANYKADSFWKGTKEINLSSNPIKIQLNTLQLEWNSNQENIRYFFNTGTISSKRMGMESKGLFDTKCGFKIKCGDPDPFLEWNQFIMINLIIKGSYDEEKMNAAGDGANGFESSFILSKQFPNFSAAQSHAFGIIFKDNQVPTEMYYHFNLSKSWSTFYTNLDLNYQSSLNGIYIGETGYSFPSDLNKIKESNASYNLSIHKKYKSYMASLSYLNTFKGRNTNQLKGFSLQLTHFIK